MFFALSKIFWTLVQPLNALCLLAIFGALLGLRWKKLGQRICYTALCLIVILGLVPIGPVLVGWLERQYPAPQTLPAKIDGVIVLGGAFESALTASTGQIQVNDQMERMLCFLELSQKYPQAKHVYSGGSGDLLNPNAREGDDARAFFTLVGQKTPVIYEEKSRNTYENVLYSKEIVTPHGNETWIVVTSAYHMPRAMGIFAKQNWPVIPYPCDYKTDGTYDFFHRLPNAAGNFYMLNIAIKEILGGIVYRLSGKML
jgi:uncharacterized SAM-binding protein YcdF (DUF218 family)